MFVVYQREKDFKELLRDGDLLEVQHLMVLQNFTEDMVL